MCTVRLWGNTQKNADGNKQNLSTVTAQRNPNGRRTEGPVGFWGKKKKKKDISGKLRKQACSMNFSYQLHINVGSLIVTNV